MKNWFKNWKIVIKERHIGLPSPPGIKIKSPGIRVGLPSLQGLNIAGRTKFIVMFVLLFSGLTIGGAMYFSIAGIAQASVWPEPGAAYALGTQGGEVGEELPPENLGTADQRESQTIQINLASGVRLSSLNLNGLDMGRAGLTSCLSIGRATGTSGWLYVDEMKLTGVSAPTFDLANAEIGALTMAAVTDGRTNSATIDNTISEQVIVSTRGAGAFTASDAVVDRVVVEILGDASIGVLNIENVKCSVGNFDIDYIKVGTFVLDSTSRIGAGNGIDTADLVVNTTVKTRSSTDTMTEVPLKVQ